MDGELIKISGADLLDILPPWEGSLNEYYGHIGSGKTTACTLDIFELLKMGQVVYANWEIFFDGYDERKKIGPLLAHLVGLRTHVYRFPKENLHFLDCRDVENIRIDGKPWRNEKGETDFYTWFAQLTSCHVFLDEGHILYDSYKLLKMDIKDRTAILDTRHYDRSVSIVSQRATNIHAQLRGNVNRFYKMESEKPWWAFGKTRFIRTEFQDTTTGEVPNEEREVIMDPETGEKHYGKYVFALSQKKYWARKKYFRMFNSKYRRGETPESQYNNAELYRLRPMEIVRSIFGLKPKEANETLPTFADLEKEFSMERKIKEPVWIQAKRMDSPKKEHDIGTCLDPDCPLCPE